MFGCYSIYVGLKIVLILRDRRNPAEDDGVWVATTAEHHESLRKEIPSLRDIALFGPGPTGWQVIPVDSDSFDDDVARVCQLIRKDDERVGKIPKKKAKKEKPKVSKAKPKKSKRKLAKAK